MEPKYLNDWASSGFRGVVACFEGIWEWSAEGSAELDAAISGERWQGVEVLLASYGTEDYGGDAFVLFRRGGKLYEVNGGHCSCYGLGEQNYSGDRETQWRPEETTVEALRHRLDNGTLGADGYHGNKYAEELRAVLDELAAPHGARESGGGEKR